MSEHAAQVNRLLKLMEERLDQSSIKRTDRALFSLLDAYRDQLPELDGYFHKAFRQTDPIDAPGVNWAIWQLLNESTLFWDVFYRVICDEATRRARLNEILQEYDVPEHMEDPGLDRFALIEVGEYHDWVTTHPSPEAAGRYYDNQERADSWTVECLVDLDTGEGLIPSAQTVFIAAPIPTTN